jgi:3-oxoacyl-[acyl-carrier-protein] synthase II
MMMSSPSSSAHPALAARRRVVVTGMGVISPVGKTVADVWANVSGGKSGIIALEGIPPEEMTCKVGGQINDFDPAQYMDKKETRRMDRFTQFAVAASREAWAMSGLEQHKGSWDPTRVGVVVGTGSGGIETINVQLRGCLDKGFNRCSPFLVPMMISNMAAARISIEYGAQGPSLCVVTACATGTDAIGRALRMIQYGEIDVAFAGGAEAPITPVALAGFANARALSMQGDNPTAVSRPFDKNRDGFVIAEGGAILILEAEEHALARGAKPLAYVVGYAATDDAFDIVATTPEGEGGVRAMAQALADAGLTVADVGYINAHATSTPVGDVSETKAIKTVFGELATSGQVLISATKSMHGHLLGGAGALEAIICIEAIRHEVVPPTINLDTPDEQCDLSYVPHVAQAKPGLKVAMSNSFGFGGHNATLVLTGP